MDAGRRIVFGPALLAGLVAALTTATALHAGEAWTFCSGADFPARRAWLSDPFPAAEERSDLEGWFADALASRGVHPPFVQCPLPTPRTEANAAYARAERFLTGLGFAVVHVHPNGRAGS